jgi:hypothetical protein
MGNWQTLHKQKDLTVGMWKEDSRVYFTLENLTPADVRGLDVEVSISVKDLVRITREAKVYEDEIAED